VSGNRHTDPVIALLDRYIDRMHRSTSTAGGRFGPFGAVGALVNVVMCGALGAFGAFGVVRGDAPWFFLLIAAFLETVFVRVAVRARRGDFEEG
jgi:hypothetical protein